MGFLCCVKNNILYHYDCATLTRKEFHTLAFQGILSRASFQGQWRLTDTSELRWLWEIGNIKKLVLSRRRDKVGYDFVIVDYNWYRNRWRIRCHGSQGE